MRVRAVPESESGEKPHNRMRSTILLHSLRLLPLHDSQIDNTFVASSPLSCLLCSVSPSSLLPRLRILAYPARCHLCSAIRPTAACSLGPRVRRT